jgi:regulatory protein
VPKTIDQSFLKAKQYCFTLLKIRPRSIKELDGRLRQKRYTPELIKKVMATLIDIGLLDDTQFAYDWVTWRMANGYGKHRIVAELKQKGIVDTLIAQTMDQALIGYDEERIANDLAQKRMKRYKNLEPVTLQRRLYGFLVRKGFSQNTVLKIVHAHDNT